ncbi:MAG: hypothetical protein L0Y72_31955 [Gemmataceae bacterium]|nr:hypothetical protein [Gemmataceae bacterium]
MRCLNCLTVCSDDDPNCPVCKKPFAKRSTRKPPIQRISKFALVFLLIGQGFWFAFAWRWFPPGQGTSLKLMAWAGVVGAVSVLVGGLFGMLMAGPETKE